MKKSKHNIPNNLNCLSSQLTDHSPTLANIYGHPWNNWRETDTMNELRKAYMYDYSRNKLFNWRIWFVLLPNLIKLSHYLFCRTAHEREPISKTDWLEELVSAHSITFTNIAIFYLSSTQNGYLITENIHFTWSASDCSCNWIMPFRWLNASASVYSQH